MQRLDSRAYGVTAAGPGRRPRVLGRRGEKSHHF
jgi:hypothetical protein